MVGAPDVAQRWMPRAPRESDACLWHVSLAGGARRRGCAAEGVSAFLGGPPPQLAAVERRPERAHELERDAHARPALVDVATGPLPGGERVAHAHDHVTVAMDRAGRLHHHAAQLEVRRARLDLQRAARVALEIADLLGLPVGPDPAL